MTPDPLQSGFCLWICLGGTVFSRQLPLGSLQIQWHFPFLFQGLPAFSPGSSSISRTTFSVLFNPSYSCLHSTLYIKILEICTQPPYLTLPTYLVSGETFRFHHVLIPMAGVLFPSPFLHSWNGFLGVHEERKEKFGGGICWGRRKKRRCLLDHIFISKVIIPYLLFFTISPLLGGTAHWRSSSSLEWHLRPSAIYLLHSPSTLSFILPAIITSLANIVSSNFTKPRLISPQIQHVPHSDFYNLFPL